MVRASGGRTPQTTACPAPPAPPRTQRAIHAKGRSSGLARRLRRACARPTGARIRFAGRHRAPFDLPAAGDPLVAAWTRSSRSAAVVSITRRRPDASHPCGSRSRRQSDRPAEQNCSLIQRFKREPPGPLRRHDLTLVQASSPCALGMVAGSPRCAHERHRCRGERGC
jgi:hypothetical protein